MFTQNNLIARIRRYNKSINIITLLMIKYICCLAGIELNFELLQLTKWLQQHLESSGDWYRQR